MAESPNNNTGGIVRCHIFSEGKSIKHIFGLISVSVFKAVNRIGKAEIVFEAGDMPKAAIPESDDDTFAIGKNIRIEAGYGQSESVIFEGMVTSHNIEVEAGNRCTLCIECRDYAFPATLSRQNRVFANVKDGEAITKILGNYSPLSASVGSTTTKYNELVQYYATDWDFVLSRADVNGFVVTTEGKDISIKKPVVNGTSVIKVKYGIDILEFSGQLVVSDQIADIEAFAWSSASQELITAKGSAQKLNTQGDATPSKLSKAVGGSNWSLQTESITDKGSLEAWANSQLLKTGLSRIRGNVKFCGNSRVVAGCTIDLDGFGKRFNGKVYVGEVRHEIRGGMWTTTAGMGIAPENITESADVVAPPASGFLPGISGLHIGKVVKLDGDPTKEHKIQVKIPIINSADNTVWARLSSFWASKGFGSFFIPDVGDEVILGFFNDDPCYPVILGSLYSSAQAPDSELTKENFTRAIVTKTKMKLTFDEEKKVITIETPGRNKIEISDDAKGLKFTDQNKNMIEMNDSGITIKSPKKITIKSDQDIAMDAGMNYQVKAKSNVNLKGMNVDLKADVGLTAKGTATAEFSASGQTTLKGGIVMIN